MRLDELAALAAPSCHCGEPITRTEIPWRWQDGEYRLDRERVRMVCAAGHRLPVEEATE